MNAAQVILERGRATPRKPALIADGETVSHGALAVLTGRCARALRALGLDRGDCAGIMLKDSPHACAAFLGAVSAGAVAVPMNPRLAAADYRHIATEARMPVALVDEEYLPLAASMREAGTRIVSAEEFIRLADASLPAGDPVDADPASPAFWLFSSGTTGRPKGIIHCHASLANSGKMLREAVGATADSVMLCTSKYFFAFGLDNGLLGPLSLGATTIINSVWPDTDRVIEQATRHQPDCLFTVPTFYRRLLALGKTALAPLGRIPRHYTGGERVPETLAAHWREATGVELHVCYGMSETYTNTITNYFGRNRRGTMGERLPGVETRLLDADDRPVAPGEPGILWVKHRDLALSYSNEAATRASFRDGWFRTGDLCTEDADGFFRYEGRADELIKVAGQWVKPGEVEEAALSDPHVREAACVVVPDADGFERLALFVVPSAPGEGEAAARERCGALPGHSRPKWIREIAEIPKTATGKIQRFKLKEAMLREGR